MSYLSVSGHRSMALDVRRNDAYRAALEQAITPDSVVLDLGAGTGVLGLMAARLGARRVYLVEPEDVIAVAEEIVRANSLQDVVTCLQGRIEDVKPPEPVDVIVSVLTGNFLLTEDLLRTLYHARDTVLAPGGVLIPSAATMEAVPVSLPEVHAREIGGWSTPQHGVDLSPARAYAANTIFYRPEGLGDARPLAEPKVLHTVDLTKDQYTALDVDAAFEVIRSGQCHGWLGWFSMKLGDRWLSTSPFEPPLHWSPAFLPLDPPMPVRAGETLSLALNRAPFGDWIWSATAASTMQQHSTLLSAPVNLSTVRKVAVTFRPSLDPEGAAVQYVLSCCDGSTTVERIAKLLSDRFPQRYPAHEDALGFVQRLVKRYA